MHFPVLALISAAAFEVAGARPFHGGLAVAGIAIALGVCLAMFHVCERHFIHERLTLEAGKAA
jgi:hypothetical protein